MRPIKSPNAFKTCYIADIKERLGLRVRTSPNRKSSERKIKCPKFHSKFIKEAIKQLQNQGEKLTYKNIQKVAFEIYKERTTENKINKYLNSIKTDKSLTKKDIDNILELEVFELEN